MGSEMCIRDRFNDAVSLRAAIFLWKRLMELKLSAKFNQLNFVVFRLLLLFDSHDNEELLIVCTKYSVRAGFIELVITISSILFFPACDIHPALFSSHSRRDVKSKRFPGIESSAREAEWQRGVHLRTPLFPLISTDIRPVQT